ncbi:MAG: hypothetical protein ACJAVK_002998 [Akkermansiaceae bacterium]
MDEVGAGAFLAETFAGGLDAKAFTDGAVAETAGEVVVLEIKVGVLELDHFSAIDTDEVVVVGVVNEVGIVGGLAIAEFDFVDEVCFHEEPEGAVDGGAGGLGTSGAKAFEEFVGREVLVGGEDDFEDFIPLRSLSQSFLADEIIQSVANHIVHDVAILGVLG